jgi:hypothetical protein
VQQHPRILFININSPTCFKPICNPPTVELKGRCCTLPHYSRTDQKWCTSPCEPCNSPNHIIDVEFSTINPLVPAHIIWITSLIHDKRFHFTVRTNHRKSNKTVMKLRFSAKYKQSISKILVITLFIL